MTDTPKNNNDSDSNTASAVHPTLWIRESKGTVLFGKTIVIGVTGSIAAVQTVQLARELIRFGATVYAVTTDAALRIIHEDALHYATGNPVITRLTGRVEHVEFFGAFGRADLLLIAPATANTISKIAAGIDDTPVTAFATTAIGEGKKVMVVPAMHESMYRHPKVLENLQSLESLGIDVIGPFFEEGIAKIAGNDEIVLRVIRSLGDQTLAGKSVFITSGSTAESIDPIRLLTNRASGRTGSALAREAYIRGAEVYLFHRTKSPWAHLPHFHDIYTESVQDMISAVTDKIALADLPKSGKNILISAAAISDYTVEKKDTKIKSGERELTLTLRPTKKLIEEACYTDPNLLIVGFKAETGVLHQELIDIAAAKIEAGIADMVVANDVKEKGMGTADNDVWLVTKDYLTNHDMKTVVPISGNKEKIAAKLFDYIAIEASKDAPQVLINLEIRTTGPADSEKSAGIEISDTDLQEDDAFDVYLSDGDGEEEDADDSPLVFTTLSSSRSTLRRKPAQMKGRTFGKRN
ncbi:MAG: bifunctional phosphopantothenoylcysteine decarboxylase/phosphopantothenate--cysteine ligase CoaBC [Methanimicrococcus sp.]|nr:bifunctional phosphopantothenoylcysteine decarboxylase/phosphopantothenate--cysteine ligase CoaBC [Methanimicrococcus sp.]